MSIERIKKEIAKGLKKGEYSYKSYRFINKKSAYVYKKDLEKKGKTVTVLPTMTYTIEGKPKKLYKVYVWYKTKKRKKVATFKQLKERPYGRKNKGV